MPRRTILVIEVNEILFRWCQDVGKKTIARSLKVSVNTVRDLIIQAESLGLKRFSSTQEEIERITQEIKILQAKKRSHPGVIQAQIGEHHQQIKEWWGSPHITIRQIQRLLGENGDTFGETSLRRYIHAHFTKSLKGVIHLITLPGKEAQVDFGYVGFMFDPKMNRKRKAHAFVMTLSHSRLRFVRFVFKQDVTNWIDCHIRAFEFFGGIPEVVVLDNLKAGVIKPELYDPLINRAYAELERYYGFVVDPTRVRTPTHKGKVERSIPIVRQQILAGRAHADIEAANIYALHWARYEISQRITRTTGETPWVRFERDEKIKLKALPSAQFECPQWQEGTVHRDHHVVFCGSFYSVPNAYLGKNVWVRGSTREVQFYCEEKLIKIHPRTQQKGEWVTDNKDYPEHAREYLILDENYYLEKAKALGEDVHTFIKQWVSPLTRTRQRKIFALFRLGEEYGNNRLNKACKRAMTHDNDNLRSVQRILEKCLDLIVQEEINLTVPLEGAYLRDPKEFCINVGGNPE